MAGTVRGERLQIMLTKAEIGALDDWRFARHMPSRAAAIRELLKRGLTAEGFDMADRETRSRDFGVIAKGQAKSAADAKARPGR
jgi:hypothetical protein